METHLFIRNQHFMNFKVYCQAGINHKGKIYGGIHVKILIYTIIFIISNSYNKSIFNCQQETCLKSDFFLLPINVLSKTEYLISLPDNVLYMKCFILLPVTVLPKISLYSVNYCLVKKGIFLFIASYCHTRK